MTKEKKIVNEALENAETISEGANAPESSEETDKGIFYVLKEHVISDKVKYFDKHGFKKVFHSMSEAKQFSDKMNEDNTDDNISYIIVRIA